MAEHARTLSDRSDMGGGNRRADDVDDTATGAHLIISGGALELHCDQR